MFTVIFHTRLVPGVCEGSAGLPLVGSDEQPESKWPGRKEVSSRGTRKGAKDVDMRQPHSTDFLDFATRHNKFVTYCPGGLAPCEESRRREAAFKESALRVAELGQSAAAMTGRTTFASNFFADQTHGEFRSSKGMLEPTAPAERQRSEGKRKSWVEMHKQFLDRNQDIWGGRKIGTDLYAIDPADLPKSWDWRDKGAVSTVWEQGACGGCWAFTTVTAVEGVHYIWTREQVTLSPQMLLECDPIDSDCVGGNMVTGYQYAVMKGGIPSAESYPFNPYTRVGGTGRIMLTTSSGAL